MKKLTASYLVLAPIAAIAQNPYAGINQADMQNMMQQMQEAQVCMEKIDREKLQKLENRGIQFESEMKSLCASGKRNQAQSEAIKFSREILDNQSIQELRNCTKNMQGMMKNMAQQIHQSMPTIIQDRDYSNEHVCDGLN